jgi:hypothetical protein
MRKAVGILLSQDAQSLEIGETLLAENRLAA